MHRTRAISAGANRERVQSLGAAFRDASPSRRSVHRRYQRVAGLHGSVHTHSARNVSGLGGGQNPSSWALSSASSGLSPRRVPSASPDRLLITSRCQPIEIPSASWRVSRQAAYKFRSRLRHKLLGQSCRLRRRFHRAGMHGLSPISLPSPRASPQVVPASARRPHQHASRPPAHLAVENCAKRSTIPMTAGVPSCNRTAARQGDPLGKAVHSDGESKSWGSCERRSPRTISETPQSLEDVHFLSVPKNSMPPALSFVIPNACSRSRAQERDFLESR